MNKTQLAINSVSTGGEDLPSRLAAYKAAGFDNVEFHLEHVHEFLSHGNSIADARQLIADSGLRCIGGFETELEAFSPPNQREKNHRQVIANAELIGELGGGNLVVGTDGPAEPHSDPLGYLAEIFHDVAEQIPPTVNICIEFNWSPIVKSLRAAAEIARKSGSANVGVIFDPAHYHCTPTKFDQLNPANVQYIKHVHVNDMRDKPGELCDCNSDRELPGNGILDLRGIYGRIEELGYNGYFSIEMFSDYLRSLPVEIAAKQMYASLLPLCAE